MGKIIDLSQYRSFMRQYRTISVNVVRDTIEINNIGNFVGKTEAEIQEFYEELTDRLNDMVEKPSGTTAYEVGKLLDTYEIKPKDFDLVFNMIKGLNEFEHDFNKIKNFSESDIELDTVNTDLGIPKIKKYEELNNDYDFEITELEFDEESSSDSKIEPDEFEQSEIKEYDEEEKEDDDFIEEISEGLEKQLNETLNKEKSQQKASVPYKVISEIGESTSNNILEMSKHQRYKSISTKKAGILAKLFGKAHILKRKAKTVKPVVKSKPKKVDRQVKFKGKKGLMAKIKEKSELKKMNMTRNAIEFAKEYTDLLIKKYQERISQSKANQFDLNPSMKNILDILKSEKSTIENVADVKTKVMQERNKQISNLVDALSTIQTGKLRLDLEKQGLSDEQINALLGDYIGLRTDGALKELSKPGLMMGIDEKGDLELSKKSPLKLEDIKGTELEEELRIYAMMPKVRELSDEEILQLAKSMKIENGKIRVNFSYLFGKKRVPGDLSWVSEEVPLFANKKPESKKEWNKYIDAKRTRGTRLKLFANLYGSKFYLKGMESLLPDALENLEEIGAYDYILDELDNISDLKKSQTLEKQISFLDYAAQNLEEESKLTRKDKKTRKELRKIAENKIQEIEEQGISLADKISSDGRIEETILSEGRGKLNIDAVINRDTKKIDKLKSQEEK